MTVVKFAAFIDESRKDFRDLISKYLNGNIKEMKDMIKNKVEECESDFEVNVLKENLQEELRIYFGEL